MSQTGNKSWAVSGQVGYTYIPYDTLQQGTQTAANPNDLSIGVHLATSELRLNAPTQTELNLQLPVGRLVTHTVSDDHSDSNLGDLELRVRQDLAFVNKPRIQVSGGLVLPTGPYVSRSGAANLPPEASFVTLGRGVTWGVAEVQSSIALSDANSVYAQLSYRKAFASTKDGFDWGDEARGVIGNQWQLPYDFSALAIFELQWRSHSFEPNPFGDGKLKSSNAGGTWWTVTPALSYAISDTMSVLAGARVPVHSDVHGNQLVPSLGGFVAFSAAWAPTSYKDARRQEVSKETQWTAPKPTIGKITIVDYWATWCAPCKGIEAALTEAMPNWSDVVLIKVDASNWPLNGIILPDGQEGLPVLEIYDTQGKRAHLLTGTEATKVVDYVNRIRQEATPPSQDKEVLQ